MEVDGGFIVVRPCWCMTCSTKASSDWGFDGVSGYDSPSSMTTCIETLGHVGVNNDFMQGMKCPIMHVS